MSIRMRNGLISAAFLLAFFIIGSIANVTWDEPVSITSAMFFSALCIAWTASVEARVTKRREKRLFVAIGLTMLLLMVDRTVKYSLFLDNEVLERQLWYAYYIPILFIPLFTLMISLCLGKSDDEKLSLGPRLLFIPAVLLIIGIMTNDLHGLAFSFRPEFVNWTYDYSYGPLYYLAAIWIAGIMIASLTLTVRFSAKVGSGRSGLIPLGVLLLSTVFVAVYIFTDFMRTRIMNVPELFCFCAAAYLEACLQTGLIPSNTGYELLFMRSHFSASIADADGRTIYESSSAGSDGAFVRHEKPISGGTVTWLEDVTAVTRQKEELEQANVALAERAEIRKKENELKEERAAIAEQAVIYGKINASLAPQTELVRRLVSEAEGSESAWKKRMPLVCVIGAHIKRKSNMMLLAASTETIPMSELSSAFREQLSYLEMMGVKTEISAFPMLKMPPAALIYAFEEFEKALESRLPGVSRVKIEVMERVESVLFDIKLDSMPLLFEIGKEGEP